MEVCSRNELDPKTVLLKINGTSCNLNCIYCSEIKKDHKHQIPLEQIQNMFKNLPFDTAIILHGGEPLLDFKYFKKVFFMFKEKKFKYKLSLQTNGILDYETINFLCENNRDINIGISIDGSKDQNIYRVDKNNNPVFDQVVKTIRLFEKRGVNIKCIVTVNAVSASSPNEILDFFLGFKNINQIRFNPCFDSINGKLNEYAVSPAAFFNFLRILAIRWINEEIYREIHIDPLQSLAERILKNNITGYKYLCNNYISIYPYDKYTLCDALNAESFMVKDYSKIFDNNIPMECVNFKCSVCSDYMVCGGGCYAMIARFENNQKLSNEYCLYRKGLTVLIRDLVGKEPVVLHAKGAVLV